ncbi:glycosyltransferase [Planctomycetota bacterium]
MIKKLREKKPFDLVFGRGFRTESDLAIRLGKRFGIPAAGVGIGSDVNIITGYGKRFHEHFIRVATELDVAMATGEGVAEKISKVTGRTVPVIGGLVDLNKFSPAADKYSLKKQLGLDTDKMIILFAGHLKATKGVFELIDAFVKVRKHFKNVILNICGDGAEYGRLKEIVKTRELNKCIYLRGNILPSEMHKWMQVSDIFVLPSYNEGMPNVVMEAMACGVTVLATIVGGLPAAVGDSKGAILIEPRRSDQLAATLLRLLSNSDQLKATGRYARETAEAKFCIKQNTARFIEILRHTIANYN